MADQTLAALRELTNAVVDEFFGNDTNLSRRLIKATNEAQLLLMAQPPDAAWGQQQPTPDAEGELADLAGCVEAWAARLDEGTPEERLLGRVAAVLRQRQAPPREGEVDALIKILSRIAGMLDFMPDGPPDGLVIHRAIELLRQLTPPAEGEAGGAVADLEVAAASYFNRGFVADSRRCRRAAALLQEQAAKLAMLRQMAVPVPVSERPWTNEAGWLDPDGECWWCPPDGPAYWSMANPAMVYGGQLLPAHAIPVPPENRYHA